MPQKITKKEMTDAIRALDMIVFETDGEIRVKFRGANADSSINSDYFTDDREDAVRTAKLMKAQREALAKDRLDIPCPFELTLIHQRLDVVDSTDRDGAACKVLVDHESGEVLYVLRRY